MGQRDQQYEQRRKEILDVSLDLFVKWGFAATKIKDIANAAKMSVGLLFHYFPSKEAVYHELISHAAQGMREVKAFDKSNPLLFLEMIVENTLEELMKDVSEAKYYILMIQAMNSAHLPDETEKLLKKTNYIERIAPIIEEGQRKGQFREGSPQALAVAFCGAIQGIAEIMVCYPGMPCPSGAWILDILKK